MLRALLAALGADMTQTVGHYLKVYSLRKAMMDKGTTNPNDIGRQLIDKLVAQLIELDPSLLCHLTSSIDEENNNWYRNKKNSS